MNEIEYFSNHLLNKACHLQASDIHFLPSGDKTNIFFRINGERLFHMSLKKADYESLLTYYKFTSGMDIGESRKPQDGALGFHLENKPIDLRLSTLPVEKSESLAIRLLPRDLIPQLDDLFLFPNQVSILKDWIKQKFGIILFTGPTGSGKTTTMYSLLQAAVKQNPYQAITLEDPIEQELDSILQVQVNEKAGISYDTGLKAALRHDPDIIMIGEIRDRPTARFAFHAAFTGHLVLSTIHSKNAFGTIFRLLEMGISKTDLEQSLIGIASQQLISISSNFPSKAPKRVAILELLDKDPLHHAINGISPYTDAQFESFERLRRKAYALGFMDERKTRKKENKTNSS